jgi:hypothetical protein
MPRCEGLPEGPCPHNVNNRSVKLTQGDLMLCSKCEAIRFPPAQLSSCLESGNTNDNSSTRKTSSLSVNSAINVKSKTKQTQPAAVAVATLASSGAEDNATCENNCAKVSSRITATTDEQITLLAPITATVGGIEYIGEFKEDPSTLIRLVQRQQLEISRLQTQLNYVLSFLGIDEGDISIPNDTAHSDRFVSLPNLSHSPQDAPAASSEVLNDLPSWTEVVRRKQISKKPSNLQQSVVAAVYVDQSLKKRRETSLIVSGLEPSPGKADSELFSSLCSNELHIQPEVVKTKRLGNDNSSSVKPRPLLVILRETDQAQQLISSARLLRRSSNQAIRDRVYINPNLTKAEAEAAYLLRVKRRQTSQQRSDRSDGRDRTHLLPASDHSSDIPTDATTSRLKAAASCLNPHANQFTPEDVYPHSSE